MSSRLKFGAESIKVNGFLVLFVNFFLFLFIYLFSQNDNICEFLFPFIVVKSILKMGMF